MKKSSMVFVGLTISVLLYTCGDDTDNGRPTNSIESSREQVSDGYRVTGRPNSVMVLVAVDAAQQNNEDIYRTAVSEICGTRPICQVLFWVERAPSMFPMTDAQVASKIVHWQYNANSGLRRWLVKCSATKIFSEERECM